MMLRLRWLPYRGVHRDVVIAGPTNPRRRNILSSNFGFKVNLLSDG